jgi:hypothetical protein
MYPFHRFDLVEVWNGQWASDLLWQADNEAALAESARGLADGIHRSRWRPAIGNSDVHLRGQIGTPQTVVLADGLGSDAILAATRAGHCWIAGSAEVNLAFVAGLNAVPCTATLFTSVEETSFIRVEVRHPTSRIAALTNPITLI